MAQPEKPERSRKSSGLSRFCQNFPTRRARNFPRRNSLGTYLPAGEQPF